MARRPHRRVRTERRQAHHGRTTERVVSKVEIDADAFAWEGLEAAVEGAWCFYASWIGGPVAVEDAFGPEWRLEPTVLNAVRQDAQVLAAVENGDPLRAVVLRDGPQCELVCVVGGDDEAASEQVRERVVASVADAVGRRGMLELALVWTRDGPGGVMDPEWERRPLEWSPTVVEAFALWRDACFHDGWSMTLGERAGPSRGGTEHD